MDRKGILMAVSLAAFAVIWFMLMGPKHQPLPPQVVENTDKGAQSEGTVEKKGDIKSLDNPDAKTSDDPAKTSDDPEKKDPAPEVKPDNKTESKKTEESFEPLPAEFLATEQMVMTVDPQRGVTEVELLKHKDDDKTSNVKIGSQKFPSLFLTGEGWKLGKPSVTKTPTSISITRQVVGLDLSIVQTITLSEDYQFKTTFNFINSGDKPINISKLGLNCGNMKPLSENVGMMAGMDQAVDLYDIKAEGASMEPFQDILKELKAKGVTSYPLEAPEAGFQWISVKNRYFAWIIDLEGGFSNCELSSNSIVKGAGEEAKTTDLVTAVGKIKAFTVAPGASKEITFDCYSGPQELNKLSSMTHSKKSVMQLNLFMWYKVGWIGFISEFMLKALLWLYSFVGNYGVAIIMLTIIVKGLFWRLTNKSTESMKKMSSLSPQMKEINEKYKDNPQVKNQEVMKLYRENGVNPVAGCLPLFLQMPVFIALFNAFRGAIELRHSEFLWVADLSQPDTIFSIGGLPIRPLAIAWAVSMLLQQKIVPSTADPTQKKIMMFMPVFMLFVCYGMPSGLTLYWTFSTVMSILQYYLYNKKKQVKQKNRQL